MPWMRNGDNAATYPALMSTRADRRSDERTVNEVAGWLWRCATQSAGHTTDYAIDVGTAEMLGGSRTRELVRLCKKVGLLTETRRRGMPLYLIVDDPEFIHIRLKAEVEWERQQRNDTRDDSLKVPILRRDGDNCRWCGVLVQWVGRRTNRRGTFDHMIPGEAGTVSTMIVACLGCNSGRKDTAETWDADHELRPPPAHPNYGQTTAKYLTNHGYPTTQNVKDEPGTGDLQRPAPAPGADTAHQRVRPATTPSDDPARTGAEPASNDVPNASGLVDSSRSAGSGRVGSGMGSEGEATGLSGTPPSPARRRRRGRRGGRSKPGTDRGDS